VKRSALSLFLLFILCSTLVSLLKINVAKAEPETIVVPDDYLTIGWAIGNASEGDTIFVKKGTYYEHLQVNKSLSLVGEDKKTTIIDGGNVGTVVKITRDGVNVTGFTIRNSGNPIQLPFPFVPNAVAGIDLTHNLHYCNIVGNCITNNENGIALRSISNKNIVSGNTITDNDFGILLYTSANNNIISGNNITDNSIGIWVDLSVYHNIISGNNITDNGSGVLCHESFDNSIIGNTIADNYCGIGLRHGGTPDIIYHNNFINNTVQAHTELSIGTWDNGSEGNYWDDYTGADADGDGIGDTPHIIDENNQDSYPFMTTLTPYVIVPPPDTTSPTISIVSPENKKYTVNTVSLNFTVGEPTSWIGYSLDGQANVTISGNTTLFRLSEGSHSLTVYAKDTTGNTGSSEIVYFSMALQSEPQHSEPFPTTLILAAIVIIAVVGAALLVFFRKIKKTTEKAEIISEGVM
jgi:parallel beta-helix repeat protein